LKVIQASKVIDCDSDKKAVVACDSCRFPNSIRGTTPIMGTLS